MKKILALSLFGILLLSFVNAVDYIPYSGAIQNVNLNNKNVTNIDRLSVGGIITNNAKVYAYSDNPKVAGGYFSSGARNDALVVSGYQGRSLFVTGTAPAVFTYDVNFSGVLTSGYYFSSYKGFSGFGTSNPKSLIHLSKGNMTIDNSYKINFLNASNLDDGTAIYKAGGNALRIHFNGNNLIFQTLDNKGIALQNSTGQNKIILNTTGAEVQGSIKLGSSLPQANKLLCWTSDGTIGYCSDQPSNAVCNCIGIK